MGIRIAKVLNLLDLCSFCFFVASLNAGIYIDDGIYVDDWKYRE